MANAIKVDEVRAPKETFALVLAELEQDEPTAAVTLRAAFETMFANAEEWAARAAAIRVTSVDQVHEMKLARETRLALREIRVNGEKARKRLKENIVRQGKAIDGISNVLKALIEPLEQKLLIDETFAERAEEEAKKKLGAERAEMLLAYGADPAQYVSLGEMAEETWALTKETARLADEQRKADAKKAEEIRLEAERIAAEREEAARREAVRLEAERVAREKAQVAENERLRKEKDEQAAAAKAERERLEGEAKALEAERKKAEAERVAAAKQATDERLARVEAEAKLAQAQREEEARTRKAEATHAAEEKRRAEEAERAELAPDKEKLVILAQAIAAFPLPTFTTAKGKAAAEKVRTNFGKLADWITKTAGEL